MLCRFLGIVGRVHWRRMCSICAQNSGAYVVDGILMIALMLLQGQALTDFGETGLGIVVLMLGMG